MPLNTISCQNLDVSQLKFMPLIPCTFGYINIGYIRYNYDSNCPKFCLFTTDWLQLREFSGVSDRSQFHDSNINSFTDKTDLKILLDSTNPIDAALMKTCDSIGECAKNYYVKKPNKLKFTSGKMICQSKEELEKYKFAFDINRDEGTLLTPIWTVKSKDDIPTRVPCDTFEDLQGAVPFGSKVKLVIMVDKFWISYDENCAGVVYKIMQMLVMPNTTSRFEDLREIMNNECIL